MRKAYLAIDPLASPRYLVERFNNEGFEVIALQTIHELTEYQKLTDIPFFKIIHSEGNLKQDVAAIRAIPGIELIWGFYGIEASVPYADQVLTALFPQAANSCLSSQLRHNKFSMLSALGQAGFNMPEQILLSRSLSKETIIENTGDFFQTHNQEIVIKPASGSAGSVGVFSPTTLDDIANYFNNAKASLYAAGDFLLQEKIQGQEYCIDCVSYQGKHQFVGSVGRYNKSLINGAFEYIYADQLKTKHQTDLEEITDFCKDVLNILQMHNGFSHLEIIKTSAGKLFLIELNPRISGAHGFFNIMAKNISGVDQIDTCLSLTGQKSLKYFDKENIYQRLIFLKNNLNKKYLKLNTKLIQSLASYCDLEILKSRQDEDSDKQGPVTLIDSVAFVQLNTQDPSILAHDTELLLDLDKRGELLL